MTSNRDITAGGKTMLRRLLALGILAACALLFFGDQARGGFRHIGMDGDGNGPYINLIMREVRVTPILAHVGDVIRVDMVIENRGDLGNDTVKIELLANGKGVASQLYNYGFGGEGERIYRATFHWDTKGVKPGEYKVRGEVFVWYDASPFDNFLDVNQPLVLLAPGTAFPAGETGGGSARTRDPRYKPSAGSGEEEAVRPGGRKGIY
jgi:hypothetical protein